MSGLLARLDAYGADDPDFNEGHPEDRCPVMFCEAPVIDHPVRGGRRAKWRHRFAAVVGLFIDKLDAM